MNECHKDVECTPFLFRGSPRWLSGGDGVYSFDAYGRRRDKDNWSYTIDDTNALFADRGFTGHEYLTQFGLINMNGRLYDPLVGRFLSPDNYVQSPGSTQGYNRYSYCLNNPLRYTDPSGESIILTCAIIFGTGVLIEYGSQVVSSIMDQREKDSHAKINWGRAFYNDVDFFDVGMAGAFDVVTFGISKWTKIPKIARIGLKGINLITRNSLMANIDFKDGHFVEKEKEQVRAELWARVTTDMTLGSAYDFGIDYMLPKNVVGDLASGKVSDIVKNIVAKAIAIPAKTDFERHLRNLQMPADNQYQNNYQSNSVNRGDYFFNNIFESPINKESNCRNADIQNSLIIIR